MKCSYGWFKRWSRRFHIQLRYSHDEALLEWILAEFDANESVTHQSLQTYGLHLIRKENPDFKASSGWATRFCRRHRALLDPLLTEKPASFPPKLEDRGDQFSAAVRRLISDRGVSAAQTGCMDELILPANNNNNNNNSTEANNNSMRQAGIKDARAVVMLATKADGSLLPPFLILNVS